MNSNMQLPVMAHLVLGYPTLPDSIRTAETYIAAGVAILELQIPFSHPTADGPVITAACQEALQRRRITVADCLEAVRTLRNKYPQQEIMLMSYANRVYTYGVDRFFQEATALGVRHVIVPDMPPMPGGWERLVPVIAANISDQRLDDLLAAGYDFFYLMSGFKITGSTFSLDPKLEQIAGHIRAVNPKARIGIGFGIDTPEQVQAVLEIADYAIIGSALIRAQAAGHLEIYLKNIAHTTTPTP